MVKKTVAIKTEKEQRKTPAKAKTQRKKKVDSGEETTPIGDEEAEYTKTPGGTRKRREVTPESIAKNFEDLIIGLKGEIATQTENKKQGKPTGNTKFLRGALKTTEQLSKDVLKKKKGARKGGNNSGFMQDAVISDAMATFLGVPQGTKMSRVECTKKLQLYILANSLQNPNNRRELLPDKKLTALLGYNKKPVEQGGHGPLYYYIIQKLIQQHFTSDK